MIVYYHIPKCAGSTLRHDVIDKLLPEKRKFYVRHDIQKGVMKVRNMPQEKLEELRIVFGHVCYGDFCGLPVNTKAITVLRDPVDRVISLFQYIGPGHYLWNDVEGASLTTVLLSGVTSTMDNAMVRQLCGNDTFLQKPHNDMRIPYKHVTRKHLENAKENLSNFALVGFQDRFDKFVRDLCKMEKWRVPQYGRQNVARRKISVSQGDVQLIREMNKLDTELYKWARENFI